MSRQVVIAAAVLFGSAAESRPAGPVAKASADVGDVGRAIFLHNWAEPETWTGDEPLGAGGDGLGPMFNAVSCVACHEQGGAGGGGDNTHNVELLNVAITRSMRLRERRQLMEQAHAIHPSFNMANASIVLHRYGFGDDGDLVEYTFWREGISGLDDIRLQSEHDGGACGRSRTRMTHEGRLELAFRQTPPLWGLGLIEEVRTDKGHLLRRDLVRLQARSSSGVSGRVPRSGDGEQGWYGWRGQVGDLREFVLNACANELGLQVPQRSQPENPLHPVAADGRSPRLDLTKTQVVALTSFIANLPRPVRIFSNDPLKREAAAEGEAVFARIGCAECHVESLGNVKEIYSDLLLHDMGPTLADRSTAIPDLPSTQRSVSRTGGYSGGSNVMLLATNELTTNIDQEWRTPPLWGAADSAPYLHDGRAATFDEAITLHDGEAAASAREYRHLSEADRSNLLTFLGTLRAPQEIEGGIAASASH